MSNPTNSFEILVDQLGDPGRFQVLMLLLMYVQEIPVVWATLMMSFSGKVPDWWCRDNGTNITSVGCSDCLNDTYKYCPANQSTCNNIYFDPMMTTVVSKWSLVCDSKTVTATMTSIQMAGNLVGAIVSGQISDVFGRKVALYLSLLVLTISCTIAGFATSWQMFSVCSFFIGIACGGYLVTYFPLAAEFVRARWRTAVACFPFWSLGFALFGLLAWPVHDFRYLCFIIAALEAPFLFTYRYFPESIRWQLSRGRVYEAEKTIVRIVKMNRIKMPDLSQLHCLAEREKTVLAFQKNYTFVHLYSSLWRVKKTAVLQAMWCISSIVYYGLSFGARNLVGNIYLNISLSGLAELPRIPVIIFLNDRIGRRWTCFCFYLLCALACFVVAVCAAEGVAGLANINFAMVLTAKMAITAGWAALKVYTAEHYPTVIRTLGLGACNIAAGIGSIIAPYMVLMTEQNLVGPYIVIGILVVANAGLPFLLKETVNQPLEDTFIEDHLTTDRSGLSASSKTEHAESI
ncbi:solute carrier family 22 member 15-like [Haliotis cracherodii]|uniref:solute carrier family 22 member 15-like n=1 Tax=Haliotis cracherodii TaxID=6455 RepID=UPI0039ECABA2